MQPFITVSQLDFSFNSSGKDLFFKNVSVGFTKNNLHFIRGRNGAGKSTLFRILKGKVERNEHVAGTITIGEKVFRLSHQDDRRDLAATIRFVPQKFDLMLADQFSFTENLQLASSEQYPWLKRFRATKAIPSLIERFDINYDVPAHRLSGGQRQILAILMALQKDASILLLDEPTAALDDKNADMVMSFLHSLLAANKDLTVLVICHDKEIVDRYASSAYYEIEVEPSGMRAIERIALEK